VGAHNASGGDIDGERKPWSADRLSVTRIDDDDVGKGVIYLDEFEGFARLQCTWCRLRDRLRSFRSQPFASRQPRVEVADPFQNAVSRWSRQRKLLTSMHDLAVRLFHRRFRAEVGMPRRSATGTSRSCAVTVSRMRAALP